MKRPSPSRCILDEALIRVGNAEYARDNGSYGLTTLRDDHVDISGSTVHFTFRGKSGKTHEIDVRDRRVARIISRMQDLPGEHLFQYVDADGTPRHRLRGCQRLPAGDCREAFTAKDFRTWGARSWRHAPCAERSLREPDRDEGEHRRRGRRGGRASATRVPSAAPRTSTPPSSSAMRAASFASSIATIWVNPVSMRTSAGRWRF